MSPEEFAAKYGVNEQFASVLSTAEEADRKAAFVEFVKGLNKILTDAKTEKAASASSASVPVKKAVEVVEQDADTKNQTEALGLALREAIFSVLRENENVAVLLPNALDGILTDVRIVRSYAMSGLGIEEDDEESADTTDLQWTAHHAHNALNNFVNIGAMTVGIKAGDLPASMVKANKSGEMVLNIGNLPSAPKTDGTKSGAGRPVTGSKHSWVLNGEAIKVSGLNELAWRYASSLTVFWSMGDLVKAIEKQTGFSWGHEKNKTFTIKVPAGTLTGTRS